jgi:hypothetical protein
MQRGRATRDEISRRAYEIFEARGSQHGHDLDDWLQAERELRGTRAIQQELKSPMSHPHLAFVRIWPCER